MTERFTVYDIFAVLVPGIVFDVLLVLTLQRLTCARVFDWQGGFGDATVLAVVGYATGSVLQAVGSAITQSDRWRKRVGNMASVEFLLPQSTRLSPDFKVEIVAALQRHYGELPQPDETEYIHRLREKVQRAYRQVRVSDPLLDRFRAETDQMRAHAVGLILLSLVTVGSIFLGSVRSVWEHLAWIIGYGVLAFIAFWRMKDKDRAFAYHLWPRFAEPRKETIKADDV